MIERKIVEQRMKEFSIQEFISSDLRNSGQSKTKVQRTPLGEKIIIHTSRPGMIVGRKGQNIKRLTTEIKKRYNLENPQIEIAEVDNPNLDAKIIAERIALSLERNGSARFKGVAHRVLTDVMGAGALGIELTISGKVPSMRAKTWRFFSGYLKKCGDIAVSGVNHAYATALLKSGVVGIQVSIMPSTTQRPDSISLRSPDATQAPQSSTPSSTPSSILSSEAKQAGEAGTETEQQGKQQGKDALDSDVPAKGQKKSAPKKKRSKKAEDKASSTASGEPAAEPAESP